MRNKSVIVLLLALSFGNSSAVSSNATIDLNADLQRIISGINRFDANSANSSSASTIADIRVLFSTNASVLNSIKAATATFKSDLQRAKKYIPSKDTKDSPAYSKLMNLAGGYEQWLYYQNLNQALAQRCLTTSGKTYATFTTCALKDFSVTLENERLALVKLKAALNVWQQWRIKYGYA